MQRQTSVSRQGEDNHKRETGPRRKRPDDRSHAACKRAGRQHRLMPRRGRRGNLNLNGAFAHKEACDSHQHGGESKRRQHRARELGKADAADPCKKNVLGIAERQHHAAEVRRQPLKHKNGGCEVKPVTRRQTGRRKGQKREQRHIVCHEHRGESGHAHQCKHEQTQA